MQKDPSPQPIIQKEEVRPAQADPQKQAKAKQRHRVLVKIMRAKRENDANVVLQEKSADKPDVLQGFKHYKFACFCLEAGDLEKSLNQFEKAKELIINHFPVFTNLYMNLGNIEAQKKNYAKAIEFYEKVINQSPHANPKDFSGKEQLFSKHLNSFSAFVDAHTNIAVMYVQLDQFQKGFEYCEKSLELKPEDSESLINFTDILRQLGKKQQAIKHSWSQIVQYTKKHGKPDYEGFKALQIVPWEPIEKPEPEEQKHISILTVKWGARYNADYVNKLYAGILRNTTWKITFYCFTDDGTGLFPQIKVEKLQEGWKRWWGKVTLFNAPIPGRKFYIDLDMIITGNLDKLFSYQGQFATLRTGDLACEKNHKDGYNSSVMIWQGDHLRPVYETLKENFESVTKFIVRFDFWLEMTINNADYIQKLYPGVVIDFLADAKVALPQGSSVVCFARKPKPEDYPAQWVKEYWVL